MAFEFEIIRTPLYPFYYSLNVNYLEAKEQNEILGHLYTHPIANININALIPIFTSIKSPAFQEDSEVRILAMCDEYQFYVENLKHSRIGVIFTPENKASYYLKLPLIFTNEEHDQDADPLLRLTKIHFGKELESNDGQKFLLNYIIPLCRKYEIQYEWV